MARTFGSSTCPNARASRSASAGRSPGGELAGFIEYRRRPGLIAFLHTLIEPALRGPGPWLPAVRTALADARSEGLSVLPFCPFVRGYIAGHTEYLDLVPEDMRAKFELPAHG